MEEPEKAPETSEEVRSPSYAGLPHVNQCPREEASGLGIAEQCVSLRLSLQPFTTLTGFTASIIFFSSIIPQNLMTYFLFSESFRKLFCLGSSDHIINVVNISLLCVKF